MFGLRHQGAGGGDRLQGFIEEARIYNRALAQEELRGLELGKASPIRPFAWWTFDKGHEIDRMGRFPFNTLLGGARIEQGRLVLGGGTAALIATMHRPQQGSLAGPQTPAMPAHPPRSWMTYHLAHPGPGGAVPADPNCAFFWKGRYHLHYIYNHPEGCAFAHVSSTDMVHWKWHPTTLTRGFTGHGMFSGTGFLTLEGRPAIIYHGEGSGRNQIAFALDDNLERWSKPTPIEPLTASGEKPSIRHWDPDGFVKDGTYYALCGGSNPKLMKSADLKSWLYLGDLYHDRFPADLGVPREEDTSCPNLFQIGGKWMLLCISHNLGARYYLGDFVDGKYLPTHHAMLNWARWDYFAPESLLTPDGRRVIWAWCTPWVNGMQKNGRAKNFENLLKPAFFQQGIQSLPREVSLPADGTLRIEPLRELAKLRHHRVVTQSIAVPPGAPRPLDGIRGDSLELEIVIAPPRHGEFGVNLLADGNGENGFPIRAGVGRSTLQVDYVNPPFQLREGEDLTLRVFIDKSMVEVFANGRQAVVAWHEYLPDNTHVALVNGGEGELHVKRVTAWGMKSIY